MELPIEEAYRRVRSSGVAIPRPDRGLVRLSGEQRIWFLQNTVSNDVEDVPTGRWVESCFLETKGKVLAHFRAGVCDEEVWLDVDPPGTGDLVDWFVRYRFRTKVEIEDRSQGCLTVLGPEARRWVEDGEVRVDGDVVAFGGMLGDVPTADVHGSGPTDLPQAPGDVYEIMRVEAGVGRFGVDYGPRTLPQEAGLTSIVSVTKGCYIGQEVMARLHFRGHVNRVLRPLRFEGTDGADGLVGRELHGESGKVGEVTSAVRSPQQGVIGLGVVRVEVPEGDLVSFDGGGRVRVGPIPEGTKVASSKPAPRVSGP